MYLNTFNKHLKMNYRKNAFTKNKIDIFDIYEKKDGQTIDQPTD